MSKFLFEYQSFKNFRVLEDFMMPLDDAGIFVYGSNQKTSSYIGSSYYNNYYSGSITSIDNFFNEYFNPNSFKKKYRACFPNLEIVEIKKRFLFNLDLVV